MPDTPRLLRNFAVHWLIHASSKFLGCVTIFTSDFLAPFPKRLDSSIAPCAAQSLVIHISFVHPSRIAFPRPPFLILLARYTSLAAVRSAERYLDGAIACRSPMKEQAIALDSLSSFSNAYGIGRML